MLTALRQGRTGFAQWLLALALLALGTQAVLPKGYMFEANAETGRIAVVACTGQGAATRWLDPTTGRVHDQAGIDPADEPSDQSRTCPFAAATLALVMPVTDGTGFEPRSVERQSPNTARDNAVAGHLRAPSARAPPHSV